MALEKVQITIEHTGEQFEAFFNPEEYSLNKDNNFASHAVPGLSSPILQFVAGNLRTLEMELFFDTTDEQRDVREETQKVVDLLKIDSDLHAPPGSAGFVGLAPVPLRAGSGRSNVQQVSRRRASRARAPDGELQRIHRRRA